MFLLGFLHILAYNKLIPKVGTLDTLVGLSDDLGKIDAMVEG